jgi:hypothetical protein
MLGTETSIGSAKQHLIGKVVTLSGVQFADYELGKILRWSLFNTNRILEEGLPAKPLLLEQ